MTPAASPNDAPPAGDPHLRELLKRCPPSALVAAYAYRRTGDPAQLPAILSGVIAHYVQPSLRPRLDQPDERLRLTEDLGLDSLALMEIVMLVEEVLGVMIDNEELGGLRTLGDVNRLVACRLHRPPPAPALPPTGRWMLQPEQPQPS